MKFKAKEKVSIKGPDKLIVTLMKGDKVDFPARYGRHPALEKVTEKKTPESPRRVRKEGRGAKSQKGSKAKDTKPDLDVNEDGQVDSKDDKIMKNHLDKKHK